MEMIWKDIKGPDSQITGISDIYLTKREIEWCKE